MQSFYRYYWFSLYEFSHPTTWSVWICPRSNRHWRRGWRKPYGRPYVLFHYSLKNFECRYNLVSRCGHLVRNLRHLWLSQYQWLNRYGGRLLTSGPALLGKTGTCYFGNLMWYSIDSGTPGLQLFSGAFQTYLEAVGGVLVNGHPRITLDQAGALKSLDCTVSGVSIPFFFFSYLVI